MNTLEELLESENLRYTPFEVFLSLRDNIDDLEILREICTHIDFNNKEAFFESVKKFLIDYGRRISLGDGTEMAEQIDNTEASSIDKYKKAEESIIMTINRPAFLIRNDRVDDSITTKWKQRIDDNSDKISSTIPGVGRLEIKGHPNYPWAGTGWLVAGTDIIVTNKHVADIFTSEVRGKLKINDDYRGNPLRVNIDFKEEYGIHEEHEFNIKEVIYIAKNNEPDIALLRVQRENSKGKSLPRGLKISFEKMSPDDNVYVVGYPAYNLGGEIKLYDFIFKGISNVKRLAPGDIYPSSAASYLYMHDCSTWYGNSGSPVIDLYSGKVVGIHYAGSAHEYKGVRANWAVTSTYLIELLEQLNIPISF